MVTDQLLTVVIPVQNEEKNLPLCLDSVKDFKHVVIVDSGSTDNTCEIAQQYGREVVQFVWNGEFPKKRNWMLRNYKFKTPWVLFLDADERVTKKFVKELEQELPNSSHDVYFIRMYNWFLGRMLKHGDMTRKTAIVRVGHGEYEKIMEHRWSKLDMEVHEHIIVKGTVGYIRTPIEHYDLRSLSSYYDKHNQYSDWESNRYLAIAKDLYPGTEHWNQLTRRQRIKYKLFENKFLPWLYFFYVYFIKFGFLDGAAGYYFALSGMAQKSKLQAKVYEAKLSQKNSN